MTNAQNLVKMLQSEQPKARYDACEQLMLLPVLTQDAIDALSIATHDGDSSVAKAAKRALELHKSDVMFSKDTIATLNAPINQPAQKGTISQIEEKIKLENAIKSGASNFYWIAALSLINSFVILVGGNWSFFIGLGITQLVDGIFMTITKSVGNGSTSTIQIIGFIINIFFSGIFVVFGIFAHKQKKWAFITGMVLYALDSLIFLFVLDFFSIGFHIFILFGIFTGFSVMEKHNELMKQISA
jgi:hypothetical protein